MELYTLNSTPDVLGHDARSDAVPAPPGYDVDGQVKELLRELPGQLKPFGLVTPWAVKHGDLQWEQLRQPTSMNIELYRITDADMRRIFTELFYLELPYIAFLTRKNIPVAILDQAFEGTPYEYFETHAVYPQTDKRDVPQILQLHWLRRRAAGDQARRFTGPVVESLGGVMLFAQQVPAARSSLRTAPVVTFADALRSAQLTGAIASLGRSR